jgi:hypothetical protein
MQSPSSSSTSVSKRFVKPLDAAEKVANLFGAGSRPKSCGRSTT